MPDVGDTITVQIQWRVNGTLTDDAATTISALKPDGTTSALSVAHPSLGTYTAPLTFALTGDYEVTFTAPTLGDAEQITYRSSSDPRYFGLGELRAMPDMANVTTYPDTALAASRDWIEAIVERACHTSFVGKPRTELRSGNGTEELFLSSANALSVTACSINGTALTAPELLLLVVEPGGLVYRRTATGAVSWTPWPSGARNISVSYLAGYSMTPPADLKEAMLTAARVHALETRGSSGVPTRATSITNEFGNVNFSTASLDRPTGIPDVDAVILGWRERTAVFGFA